ncbi:MAG: FAD-binding oxidoreductase [Deltaproteobacteria bacterium]|nr:FAD-binding oxidoreductase [Candidatus Anaeroferrophillus wilburensis]MBN2889797.1 FAD-binding oxidoreductase [Deltaproteobacteria bacterium]
MASSTITLLDVLTADEYDVLDHCCRECHGSSDLPKLADFLNRHFAVQLSLDPDVVAGYATDSSNLPGHAEALCRPASERECAIILRACHQSNIPLTISAGQSNLTGSATAEGGVVLSLVKMTSPSVAVDATNKLVTTPVGIVLEEMRNQVLEQSSKKLYYPVDPTSRADAWIGGTLSCNASGFTPGEIGATREWVEAIDFLLPNGLKIHAKRGDYSSRAGEFKLKHGNQSLLLPVPTYPRPAIKNASGPFSSADGTMDFIDLVVGSEGLFGLITACTLKLAERPASYLELFFSLPAESNALAFLDYLGNRLAGDFGRLAALEYFGVNCRQYMDHETKLFHGNNQVGIYLQVPVLQTPIEEMTESWFNLLLAAGCGIDPEAVLLLDNEPMQRTFMEARHSMPANALEVVQQRGTYTIMTDTVVPPAAFAEFLAYVHDLIISEGIDYLSFGHFGDCHLHFTLLPEKENLNRASAIYDQIIAKSAALGGVYSGEHGTGKRKRKDFLRCFDEQAIVQLKRCKGAVDPGFLLNRGNVFV